MTTAVDRIDVRDAGQLDRGLSRMTDRGSLATVVWAPGVFDRARAGAADHEAWREVLDLNVTA